MARIGSSSRKIDTVFIVGLFTVFAATTLLVVLIAARQYKGTASAMSENYEVRTANSYLREIVHQHDIEDGIRITNFSDCPALAFDQVINSTTYTTYVYLYDGYIRELFLSESASVGPEAGNKIIEADDFSLYSNRSNLLCLSYTDNMGQSHELYISTHASIAQEEL